MYKDEGIRDAVDPYSVSTVPPCPSFTQQHRHKFESPFIMKVAGVLSALGLFLSVSTALPTPAENLLDKKISPASDWVKRDENLLDKKISPASDWIKRDDENLLDKKISPASDWIKRDESLLDKKISPASDWIKRRENLLDKKISPASDWI